MASSPRPSPPEEERAGERRPSSRRGDVRRQEGQLSTPCKRVLARTNDSRPRINFCRPPSAYGINKAQMTGLDRRTILAFVILITLLGLALRLYRLANQSLWMDEIS